MSAGESELIAAIASAPDDDGARRIYADWLAEQGRMPEAERILAQLLAAARPDDAVLLSAALASLPREVENFPGWGVSRIGYRRGVVEVIRAETPSVGIVTWAQQHAPALRELDLSMRHEVFASIAPRLVASFPALRSLRLVGGSSAGAGREMLQPLAGIHGLCLKGSFDPATLGLPALVEAGLTRLTLAGTGGSFAWLAGCDGLRHAELIGEGELPTEWPELERLWVWGGPTLTLPSTLRELSVETMGPTSLALPALSWLELRVTTEQGLLWAWRQPALQSLRLGPRSGDLRVSPPSQLGRLGWNTPTVGDWHAWLDSGPSCRELSLTLDHAWRVPAAIERAQLILDGLGRLGDLRSLELTIQLPGDPARARLRLPALPRLERLALNCHDSLICGLLDSEMTSLRHLTTLGRFEDEALPEAIARLPWLRSLTLPRADGEVLGRLLDVLPHLRVLRALAPGHTEPHLIEALRGQYPQTAIVCYRWRRCYAELIEAEDRLMATLEWRSQVDGLSSWDL